MDGPKTSTRLDLAKELRTRAGSRVKIYEADENRIIGAYEISPSKGLSGFDLRDLKCCSWDRSGSYITGSTTALDLIYAD